MFVLIESSNQALIEHLQERLHAHGVQCLISDLGQTADGAPHFAIQLPLYSQMAAARRLLYRSQLFARRIQPEQLEAFMQLREQAQSQLQAWLTSPWALRLSALCLAFLLLGLGAEALLT